MFYSFYINLDAVFNDSVVMSIPNRMVTMLASTEYQPVVESNFNLKLNAIMVLAGTIPGADCKTLGYRLGTMVRFIFGVRYES